MSEQTQTDPRVEVIAKALGEAYLAVRTDASPRRDAEVILAALDAYDREHPRAESRSALRMKAHQTGTCPICSQAVPGSDGENVEGSARLASMQQTHSVDALSEHEWEEEQAIDRSWQQQRHHGDRGEEDAHAAGWRDGVAFARKEGEEKLCLAQSDRVTVEAEASALEFRLKLALQQHNAADGERARLREELDAVLEERDEKTRDAIERRRERDKAEAENARLRESVSVGELADEITACNTLIRMENAVHTAMLDVGMEDNFDRAAAVARHLIELGVSVSEGESECLSCGEGNPRGECRLSKRPCGHHCNHSWSHDQCDWCGTTFGESGQPSVSKEQPEADLSYEDMAARVVRGLLYNDEERPRTDIEAEATRFLGRVPVSQEITEEMIDWGARALSDGVWTCGGGRSANVPCSREEIARAVLRAALGQKEER